MSVAVFMADQDGWWFVSPNAAGDEELHPLRLPRDADVAATADAMAQLLERESITSVWIGCDSRICLSAPVRCLGGASRHRDAMTFALEEQLPLSAEEMVCDFVVSRSKSEEAMGVAVAMEDAQPLFAALGQRGISVDSMTPLMFLALPKVIADEQTQPRIIIWQCGQRVELFAIRDGMPVLWRMMENDPNTVRRAIEMTSLALSGIRQLTCICQDDGLSKSVAAVPGIDVTVAPALDWRRSAAVTARAVAAGRGAVWVELCRGPLRTKRPSMHSSLSFTAIAAAILLLVFSIGCLVRTYRYQRVVAHNQDQLRELFTQALPAQSVPTGIRSRLESEFAKLQGMVGQGADLQERTSAITQLYRVFSSLPLDPPLHLLEVRIANDGEVFLDGTVASHGDAARITAALRGGGFRVDPPHTSQLANQQVSVRITATEEESSE